MGKDSFKKSYVVKNVVNITTARLLTVGVATILDAIILAKLGLGSQTDVFFVAYTIPLIIISLSQLHARTLLPLFISTKEREGEKQAWFFVDLLITFVLIILFIIFLFSTLFSEFIISIQAPGFDNETKAIGIKLSVILFIAPLLFYPIALMKNILTSFDEFFLPEVLRCFEHTVKIIFVLVFAKQIGIFSLAYGIIVAGVIHLLILYYCLRKKGYVYVPRFSFKDLRLAKAGKLISYPSYGCLIAETSQILENFLASSLPSGSLSALKIARRMIGSLSKAMSGGLPLVLLPTASRRFAKKNISEMKDSIVKSIYVYMFISIPLVTWLAFMKVPLIRLMFERNNFATTDTILLSEILLLFIPILMFSRFSSILETGFWAKLDSRTPFIVMLFRNILLIPLIIILFFNIGIYSFPIAHSCCRIISLSLLFYLFIREFGSLRLKHLKNHGIKIFILSLSLVIFLILGQLIVEKLEFTGILQKISDLFIPTFMSAIAFILIAALFRLIRLNEIVNILFPTKSSKSR